MVAEKLTDGDKGEEGDGKRDVKGDPEGEE